jgi:hypothetical protein
MVFLTKEVHKELKLYEKKKKKKTDVNKYTHTCISDHCSEPITILQTMITITYIVKPF